MNLNLIMGARNQAKTKREQNDFYATEPKAVVKFLEKLKQDNFEFPSIVWECACGQGHMAEVFKNYFSNVYCSDLIDRGYEHCDSIGDFLNLKFCPISTNEKFCIATNPPYKHAKEFCEIGLERISKDDYLMMFLKIQFLEGKKRKVLFEKNPPKFIYIYSERQQCAMNGDFEEYKKGGRTQAYIWIIWKKGYSGETITRWI